MAIIKGKNGRTYAEEDIYNKQIILNMMNAFSDNLIGNLTIIKLLQGEINKLSDIVGESGQNEVNIRRIKDISYDVETKFQEIKDDSDKQMTGIAQFEIDKIDKRIEEIAGDIYRNDYKTPMSLDDIYYGLDRMRRILNDMGQYVHQANVVRSIIDTLQLQTALTKRKRKMIVEKLTKDKKEELDETEDQEFKTDKEIEALSKKQEIVLDMMNTFEGDPIYGDLKIITSILPDELDKLHNIVEGSGQSEFDIRRIQIAFLEIKAKFLEINIDYEERRMKILRLDVDKIDKGIEKIAADIYSADRKTPNSIEKINEDLNNIRRILSDMSMRRERVFQELQGFNVMYVHQANIVKSKIDLLQRNIDLTKKQRQNIIHILDGKKGIEI
jgi:hypothetical protein